MHTVRGRFNGKTIELIDDAPAESPAYVLVTFLEGSLELAAARQQRRSVSVAMYSLDRYREPLRKGMAIEPPAIDRQRPFSVGEVMTRKIVAVPPSSNVMDAMHLMHREGITSVLVEQSGEREWGIMTMRDVLRRIVSAGRAPEQVLVDEIATRPLIYVTPETSLHDCSELMIARNIRRAVVQHGGEPVGIISDTDIFQVVEERGWGPPPPLEDDHL